METQPFSDHSFHEFLAGGRLMGSRCESCRALFIPPRPLCPQCHSWNMKWEQMKGTGRLAAVTCISFPPPALAKAGYGRENPYCTGVVELDENARVVARIEGVDTQHPGAIPTGLSVEVLYRDSECADGRKPVITFQPRQPAD